MDLNHVLVGDESDSPPSSPPKIGRLLDRLLSGDPAGHGNPVPEVLSGLGTCLHVPRGPSRDADLATLPLDLVAGVPGLVMPVRPAMGRVISGGALGAPEDISGRAVLLETGWDARWATGSYLDPGPFLSREAAELLLEAGARILGVDFWNVDDTTRPERRVHARLLGAGIPVVEGLTNLSALPRSSFRFYAVPLRIARAASVPVRAFAEIG